MKNYNSLFKTYEILAGQEPEFILKSNKNRHTVYNAILLHAESTQLCKNRITFVCLNNQIRLKIDATGHTKNMHRFTFT